MSFKILCSVAVGGALGAMIRYLLMNGIGHYINAGFPYSTLVVNVVGCFVLGSLIEVFDFQWMHGKEMRSFLVVGVLGSFTTFSAFSQDVIFLMERGELSLAGLYIMLSVVLSIAGMFAGMIFLRQMMV
jgi:CrcB protein